MTTSDGEATKTGDEAKARRELLLKVYGVAIDEYRFNVQLGWDRTKFSLLLNSGLIGAALGLLKVADGSLLFASFLALFFLLSLLLSVFGLETIRIGKSYYRQAVLTKTLVERELGLLAAVASLPDGREESLSIAVTKGQRDHSAILSGQHHDPKSRRAKIAVGTATFYNQMIFYVMIAIAVLGAFAAAGQVIIKLMR